MKTVLLPFCLLSLIAGSLAVVGVDECVDDQPGCLKCAKTYTIDETRMAVPVGCYNSQGNEVGNVLPYETLINHMKGSHKIDERMWAATGDADQIVAEYCGTAAVEGFYEYFGVEYFGECYFGNPPDLNYDQGMVPAEECAARCKWDVGAGHTMFVYKVQELPRE